VAGESSCLVCKSKEVYDIISKPDDTSVLMMYIRKNFFLCKKCFRDNAVVDGFVWAVIKPMLRLRRWFDGKRNR
jgi:hypothetical protein